MRSLLVLGFVGTVFLAGCGPQMNVNYNYKPQPTTKGQKAKDLLDCAVKASQAVPTNNRIATTPTYTTPVACNTYGAVSTYGGFGSYSGNTYCTGGQTYGGQNYSYDANAELRNKVENQCMVEKGYLTTRIPIPYCKQEQIPAGYITSSTILHEPVAGACAIDGTDEFDGSVILLPNDQLVPNRG